jgi:hypothetical protein
MPSAGSTLEPLQTANSGMSGECDPGGTQWPRPNLHLARHGDTVWTEETMDLTIITAIAAACGSLVGAATTIVTTWITQRTQTIRAEREVKLHCREALYGEFITEASRLIVDAFSHSLEKPETFARLYGTLGRIRLMAADPVLTAAEACCRQIVDLYAKPNMTVEQIRVALEQDRLDPLRDFSVACRKELLEIARGGG